MPLSGGVPALGRRRCFDAGQEEVLVDASLEDRHPVFEALAEHIRASEPGLVGELGGSQVIGHYRSPPVEVWLVCLSIPLLADELNHKSQQIGRVLYQARAHSERLRSYDARAHWELGRSIGHQSIQGGDMLNTVLEVESHEHEFDDEDWEEDEEFGTDDEELELDELDEGLEDDDDDI